MTHCGQRPGHARRSRGSRYARRVADPKKRQLRVFPGLTAEEFQHPLDIQATNALRAVPGLDTVVAKVLEYGFERMFYLDNVASNVRVTSKMFPRLYKNLQWGCKILGIEEPELYVTVEASVNAYTFGHTKPFVVLTSGLIDMLDDEERFFVLAHELGHIKANHVLYTVLARNIASIVAMLGQMTLGIGALLGQGLVFALNEWARKAELTADRAGLLCVQDLDPCIRTFMKLAGGAQRLFSEMDQSEFMRQIHEYEDADRSTLNKAYKVLLTVNRTHPYPIMRAKELDAWHQAGFQDLLES
jgi:Zn-dependent protease with chaperone function